MPKEGRKLMGQIQEVHVETPIKDMLGWQLCELEFFYQGNKNSDV